VVNYSFKLNFVFGELGRKRVRSEDRRLQSSQFTKKEKKEKNTKRTIQDQDILVEARSIIGLWEQDTALALPSNHNMPHLVCNSPT
jgi:hypothetical protein